jgi:multidrug efflux pump subunit AcrA (membrane-fusion protein)
MKSNELERYIKSFPKLPRKFFVRYALYCAKDAKHLIDNPYSLKALEVTQLWLEDKATDQEVMDAADAAYAAVDAANAARRASRTAATQAAVSAAYTAFYTAFTATNDPAFSTSAAYTNNAYVAVSQAASAIGYAANPPTQTTTLQKLEQYYNKFNEMLNELPEVEKAVYDIR